MPDIQINVARYTEDKKLGLCKLIKINGQTYFVEDRGGRMTFGTLKHVKRRLDIYFETHEEARQFGRQLVWLEVLP